MKQPVIAELALCAVIGALCGCAHPLLGSDDRARVCQVAFEEPPEAPVFRSNPMFDRAGGPALGLATGLAWGAAAAAGFAFPPLAFILLGEGLACGEAARKYPYAEAALQEAFPRADLGALKRGFETALGARREGCLRGPAAADGGVPDTVVRIERVDYLMGCPTLDDYVYSIRVKWRAMAVADRRVLGEKTTECSLISWRSVESWAADHDYARGEIERVLAAIGQRMGAELLAPGELGICGFRSNEGGEVAPW
jgi:hypothetical protein